MEYVILNNGVKMPMLGLGTYLLKPDEAQKSTLIALKNGYELIDTANIYLNECAIGRAIKQSGLPRNKIFLETKLWPSFYEESDAIDKTLKRLNVDYIDLMILHEPSGNFLSGYKKLEKAYREGKLRAIGISNFNIEEIKLILNNCEIKPMIIQVEAHPYYPQNELNEFLKKEGIILQAWYPLGGRGNNSVMSEPIVQMLSEKYHRSPAQIILRWHTQMGYIVIPGSKSCEHIRENINIFDFRLADDDMSLMSKLDSNTPFYGRNEDALKMFATRRPDVDGQK